MKRHLTLLILLHIRTSERLIEDLASFLHESEQISTTIQSIQPEIPESRKQKELTSKFSPSNTAICPSVRYLSQSPSLVTQTVHSSFSSPNGILKSGPSPAISNFNGEWDTWLRKTSRHFSLRKRCCESSKPRVWVWRVFSQVVGGLEEAGEL